MTTPVMGAATAGVVEEVPGEAEVEPGAKDAEGAGGAVVVAVGAGAAGAIEGVGAAGAAEGASAAEAGGEVCGPPSVEAGASRVGEGAEGEVTC